MTTGCSNCAQMVKITAINAKLDLLGVNLISNDLKNITGRFDDVVASFNAKLDIKPLQDTLNGCLTDSQGKFVKLEEKLESIEQHLTSFEVRNAERIEKELANTRHKITIHLDEKIKGIEQRLISKFNEILEEKLEMIFKDKMLKMFNAGS